MTEERGPSVPTAEEAYKHLRLPVIDDACENLHILTVLSTLGPHRLDAGRCTVASRFRCRSSIAGTLSERFRQVVAFPPELLEYSSWEMRSGRDLFRRTVTSTAFQVTASRITRNSHRPRASDRTMVAAEATQLACRSLKLDGIATNKQRNL